MFPFFPRYLRRRIVLGLLLLPVVIIVGLVAEARSGTPDVTKANLDRIETGMTMADVESVLGKDHRPLMDLRPGNHRGGQIIETFTDVDESNAYVTFFDDKVSDAKWSPTNRTAWQQMKLWLGAR